MYKGRGGGDGTGGEGASASRVLASGQGGVGEHEDMDGWQRSAETGWTGGGVEDGVVRGLGT